MCEREKQTDRKGDDVRKYEVSERIGLYRIPHGASGSGSNAVSVTCQRKRNQTDELGRMPL